ncbi:stem-specific protein TSJT1-like [Rhododendron vialii]|uniref:stem-specific protein TSJT1-like n=1 Tax=Rhododendron vialii TaxID=182163 RepID=UPI00265E3027|nr:stem-specific protein TSJT1-like [Rhododendron vialii]
MLAVFEKSIGNPREELRLPLKGKMPLLGGSKTGEEIVEIFRSWRLDSTLQSLPNGSSNMVLSHEDECTLHPRSIVVVDNVSCIFVGLLENMCELRRHYGLSRRATEAMVVVEAYKVLRDRAPYPPDQVI